MTRTQSVTCPCKRIVFLKRMRAEKSPPGAITKPPIIYGGICECGRGIDLRIEREPASEVHEVGRE
jgi:hypothetical protein